MSGVDWKAQTLPITALVSIVCCFSSSAVETKAGFQRQLTLYVSTISAVQLCFVTKLQLQQ